MALIATDIAVKVNGHVLLDNASVTCLPGQIVALCGPNGAGKTSLLKVLSGDINAQSGKVSFAGQALNTMPPAERARHRAVMPQQVDPAFSVNALDIIRMGLLFTVNQNEQQKIIAEVLSLFDLSALADKPYPLLSGGERQRVQLARVLGQVLQGHCHPQRYLLLDECSSAMDLAVSQRIFHLLRDLCRSRNIGIVAIMHDINLASLYADHLVLMKSNTTAFSGDPDQLIRADIIHQVFGASVHVVQHPVCARPMLIPG